MWTQVCPPPQGSQNVRFSLSLQSVTIWFQRLLIPSTFLSLSDSGKLMWEKFKWCQTLARTLQLFWEKNYLTSLLDMFKVPATRDWTPATDARKLRTLANVSRRLENSLTICLKQSQPRFLFVSNFQIHSTYAAHEHYDNIKVFSGFSSLE